MTSMDKTYCIAKECRAIECDRHPSQLEEHEIKLVSFTDYSKTCVDYIEPESYNDDQEYFL